MYLIKWIATQNAFVKTSAVVLVASTTQEDRELTYSGSWTWTRQPLLNRSGCSRPQWSSLTISSCFGMADTLSLDTTGEFIRPMGLDGRPISGLGEPGVPWWQCSADR